MENMIEITDLGKVYNLYEKPLDRLKEAMSFTRRCYHKEHFVLKNINLTINKGESIGIVGKNGSGKSTLLKIITGVLNPTYGSVVSNGKISALLELGAGFNPEYTGLENIYLNGTMMGYSEDEMSKRIQSIIDFADIGDFISQPVKTYSSGMFARLAFAVSINVEPDILIVDEALAVGDTRFQVKCIDKMKELKDKGTTILFVSHATEQIKRFCTKCIWLKDGEVASIGEAGKVVDIYENYMKYGENQIEINEDEDKEEFVLPQDSSIMASITNVQINKNVFETLELLKVKVTYDIYEEQISGFLLGVAIYSQDRKLYVFGPNTNLDKRVIPNTRGKHKVEYVIPRLPLIQGNYSIDAGIFNNEGIVNLDYKTSACNFTIVNDYFTEGHFLIEHTWNVIY